MKKVNERPSSGQFIEVWKQQILGKNGLFARTIFIDPHGEEWEIYINDADTAPELPDTATNIEWYILDETTTS